MKTTAQFVLVRTYRGLDDTDPSNWDIGEVIWSDDRSVLYSSGVYNSGYSSRHVACAKDVLMRSDLIALQKLKAGARKIYDRSQAAELKAHSGVGAVVKKRRLAIAALMKQPSAEGAA